MFKLFLCTSLIACVFAGVVHEYDPISDGETSETEHHQEIDHKHATSHQSFKFHHFHAVPVYVKKEDQQFLKHPVEIGGHNHKLKLVHPETEHSHSHGLTLENHSEFKNHKLEEPAYNHHHYDLGHAGSESVEQEQPYEQYGDVNLSQSHQVPVEEEQYEHHHH